MRTSSITKNIILVGLSHLLTSDPNIIYLDYTLYSNFLIFSNTFNLVYSI